MKVIYFSTVLMQILIVRELKRDKRCGSYFRSLKTLYFVLIKKKNASDL